MRKVTIKPAWIFTSDTGERIDPHLFALLGAVHKTHKLTLAASEANLSYRHAWNLLGKWSHFFGSPLVSMERGKGSLLTPLGEKLLWAEQRSDARLFPQLENIASELNLEISNALKESRPVIRIHASHGFAVAKLPELLAAHGHANIDLQYMGSLEALASLNRAGCDCAGFHIPEGKIGIEVGAQYAPHLNSRKQKIIRLVMRTQGLMIAPNNPLKISSLNDLTRSDIRFVNRQNGSGTRVLLDALLKSEHIDASMIAGYSSGEFTHAAVAAFVASDMADVGFGVEAAARQFKLEFIPIIREYYMLACRNESLKKSAIEEMITLLKTDDFTQMINDLPGYTTDNPGEIVSIKEAFPWL